MISKLLRPLLCLAPAAVLCAMAHGPTMAESSETRRIGPAIAGVGHIVDRLRGIGYGRDWSWLGADGGTYWYVPEEYLPAIRWDTSDPPGYTSISDQTVWHIEHFENGYIFGPIAVELGSVPVVQCQYLIGSVTPLGSVQITFTNLVDPPIGTPGLTVGTGEMARLRDGWAFAMQMSSGSAQTQIAHWAFMKQCTPDQPCWLDLPGSDDGVQGLFALCE